MGLWCPAWEELVALVRAALQVQEPVWSAQEEPILLSGSGSCSPSSSAWDIQSGLIIHGSHLCKFTYSLKFLCNLQINTLNTFSVSHVSAQRGKKLSHLIHMLPAEVRQGIAFLLWLLYCKPASFSWSMWYHVFLQSSAFCWWFLLFRMTLKCSTEVLSSAPQCS